jgi:hypothetical protein
MNNKKIKYTKKAWVEAGLKKGYLVRNGKDGYDIKKEALAPLVTGVIGGALGMAGNWAYDKARQGDWWQRLKGGFGFRGYAVPQEKLNQMKQQLQQAEAVFANMRGISPELDRTIEEFKNNTTQAIQRAEAENVQHGQGNAQAYGQQMIDKQNQQAQNQSQPQANQQADKNNQQSESNQGSENK